MATSPQVQIPGAVVIQRIINYPGISSLYSRTVEIYDKAKQSNDYVKAGLEKCENLAVQGVKAAEPILKRADEYGQIDKRGTMILESLEQKAQTVYTNVKYYDERRHQIQQTVTRTVTQPLDVALEVVDKFLPEEQHAELKEKDEGGEEKEVEINQVIARPRGAELTSTEKLGVISHKVKRATWSKLRNLQLRTEDQLKSMKFAVNLIDYAKDYIDGVKGLSENINEYKDTLVNRTYEASEYIKTHATKSVDTITSQLLSTDTKQKIEAVIEPHLKSIKEKTVRTLVVALSVIGTTIDLTSRQVRLVWNTDWSKILNAYVQRSKEIVLTLNEQALDQATKAVASLRELSNLLKTELNKFVDAGPLDYLSSLHLMATVQARLKEILSSIGLNPASLLMFQKQTDMDKKNQ